ncbi:hypothetical protein V6N13_070754 [Hibiscus sabdariffa]|uniref:Uncharacterized protein n=1 Tax=Hibiscus sabdariffa TaxID=183260 RepID=A0ABR2TG16_9ROSI
MSEESGENKNPNSQPRDLPSGRPPDLINGADALVIDLEKENQSVQSIDVGLFLERSGSPLASEVQRQCKKSRSDSVQELPADSDSMEVEENGQTLDESIGGDGGNAFLSKIGSDRCLKPGQDGSPVTYAGIVGGSARGFDRGQDGLEELSCDPNSVEVLDEDCVVDKSGKFPTIEFSERESCVGKYGRNDSFKEDPLAPKRVKVTSEEPIKERELFGPWMMVDNRRKRAPARGTSSAKISGPQGAESVNRFAMLEDKQVANLEEQGLGLGDGMNAERVEQVTLSGNSRPSVVMGVNTTVSQSGVTNRDSISTGNAKGNGRGAEKAVVLPMVEGQQVSLVEHSALGGSSEHTAVSLFEKGHRNVRSKGVVHGKLHGSRRGVRDGVQQGLKVLKPPDMRTISRPVLNEWIDTMHLQIKALSTQVDDDSGGPTQAVVNQDGILEPAARTFGTPEVRATVTAEESVLVEGGSVAEQ